MNSPSYGSSRIDVSSAVIMGRNSKKSIRFRSMFPFGTISLLVSVKTPQVSYRRASVVGPLISVTNDYKFGAEEAAKKRYDMRKYRKMMQADQKSK